MLSNVNGFQFLSCIAPVSVNGKINPRTVLDYMSDKAAEHMEPDFQPGTKSDKKEIYINKCYTSIS